jgi:hypothetical protein
MSSINLQTTEEFISKAISRHGNKYSYDRTEYVSSTEKILIGCPAHGYFYQRPYDHLGGAGCRLCNTLSKVRTWEDVYQSFPAKNTSYYQYDVSTYVKPGIKMKIICPVHGEFWQKPELHLNGSGCKKCTAKGGGVGGPGAYTKSMFDKDPDLKNKEAYFYVWKLIDTDGTPFIKIGITVNFKNRMTRHARSHPEGVPVYSRRSTLYECVTLEHDIKQEYKHLKYVPKITTNSGGLRTESFKMEIMNEFFKIE